MTITQVLYVLEVARQKSISKAAEVLYVSQPALSAQIRKLEEELGFELFHRDSQGVSLTASGQAFCDSADAVERSWKQLLKETKSMNHVICSHVRIGLGPRAFSNGISDAVAAFFDKHPETDVTLLTDIGEHVLEALEERRMDIAIDRLPPEAVDAAERFAVFPLLSERQCVLLSPEDPRAEWSEFPFEKLQNSTIISALQGSLDDRIMQESCQRYRIRPARIHRADNLEAVMALIRSGKGAALGPASFAERYGVSAVPMVPETEIFLNLICLKQNQRNPLVVQLNRYLKEVLNT